MNGTAPGKWRGIAHVREPVWVLIAIAVVYLYCFPYFPALKHANELPRILTTEELAERGSFRLDERLGELGSRADISTTPQQQHYQNKAPGVSMMGVMVYFPVSIAFGLAGHRPPLMLVTWLLRAALATFPTLVFLSYFRRAATRFADSAAARDGALIAYALGSMALPLGILFMSHAIATSLVGTAFVVSLETVRTRAHDERQAALGVGSLLGLSMLCEYQALFAAVLVGGYFCYGSRRRSRAAVALGLGILPFVVVLGWYQWSAFGSPLRTGYAYSVDAANRVGVMGIVGFSRTSLSQLVIRPDNGLLLLSPWVLLSVIGAISIAARADARARAGREAIVAALMVVAYCAFVAALEPEFGRAGWTVGPRYVAIAMPFFAWLAASGLEVCLAHDVARVPALSLVFIGVGVHVLAASTYPHWPLEFQNPLYEVSVRALREGHAPYSLGTVVGLQGIASIAPLYALVIAVLLRSMATKGRYLLETVLALIVASAVMLSYSLFATTPEAPREAMWRFVASTFTR